MTIEEAIDKKIAAVRAPQWNEYAHMLLPDFHGPWGKLVDPPGNLATGEKSDHAFDVLLFPGKINPVSADPKEEGWEEWVKPIDYEEKFGPAPTYKDCWGRA